MTKPEKKIDSALYESLERAVEATPRGRWFLSEFAKRVRDGDSERILHAICKLEQAFEDGISAARLEILHRELKEMADAIAQTRREIASIVPNEAADNRIMAATEELDAIVTATERATSDILSATERVQELTAKLREDGVAPEVLAEIDDKAIEIFTACSFQDITGQRTTKVVNVLRYLEQRVNTIIEVWGLKQPGAQSINVVDAAVERADAHLLNGPAREGEGVSQDEIDRLLNGESLDVAGDDPATENPSDAETGLSEDGSKEIDQSDIDALFD